MGLTEDRRDKSGYLYLLTTIFFFSTYEVVGKSIAGRIDAFQVNFIRFLVGGLILLGVAAIKKEIAVSRRDFALCVLAGVINVVISMSLINMSLASPALAVLSAIFFGFYTVLGKKISVRTGSLRMNAWAFMTGSLILLVFLVLTKRPVVQFDPSITGRVVYLSIFVTGLAYLSYFKGLAIAGAGKGSLVFFLKPVLATALAFFFLGERINPLVCAGIALVLAGIWIVFGSPQEKARVQTSAKD